jgi:tyrosinase
MADVLSSPGDPVFYLHHGMVDRAWKLWQSQSASHLKAMGGFTTQNGNTPTTLSYQLSSFGVLPDVEIEKVMDTEGDYLCYEYSY